MSVPDPDFSGLVVLNGMDGADDIVACGPAGCAPEPCAEDEPER